MNNLACLLLVAGAIFVPAINCVPSSEKPEWANIRLRHVEKGTVAPDVAPEVTPQVAKGAPIGDYVAGAIQLHEERFAGDLQVRCPAYGHLFKLIDIYGKNKNRPVGLQVTPDTVDALNIVAYADHDEYRQLLTKYRGESLKKLFTDAIEGLEQLPEQTDASKATWLELVDCASSLGLDAFLNEPARAQRIEAAKSASVSGSNESGAIKGPKLVSIFDQGAEFLYSELEEARAKVKEFDDEVLQTLRLRLLKQRLNDHEIEKMISVLNARKDWIRQIRAHPKDNRKKLRIGVVSSWIKYWDDLVKVKKYLDSMKAKRNKSVDDFLSDPENQKLAAVMKDTLENYSRAKNILAAIKHNSIYRFFKPLEGVYEPLVELSNKIGELVYDEEMVEEVKKYNNYKAMDEFTSQNLFWQLNPLPTWAIAP